MSETRDEEVTLWRCSECGEVNLTCPNCGNGYRDREDFDPCICVLEGAELEEATATIPPPGSVCVVLTPDEAKLAFYALALGEPTPEEKVIVDSARAKLDVAHYRAMSAKEENDG